MQYNLKGLRKDGRPAYYRPGYENNKTLKLATHDLSQLIDVANLSAGINAIPRIQQPDVLRPKQQLADLEHQAMMNYLTKYTEKGPQCLQAWLTECWWLTALPQQLNRFRESSPDIVLYLVWEDGKTIFCEKNEQGQFIPREEINNIVHAEPLKDTAIKNLWLERDYEVELRHLYQTDGQDTEKQEKQFMKEKSRRYGELALPDRDGQSFVYSNQFGLLPS